MTQEPEDPQGRNGAEPDPAEPPPSIWSFAERSPPRLLVESLLGAAAGYLLAGALDLGELRLAIAVLGAVVAPIALMLTPLQGGVLYRSIRYGGALAVLVMLVVSFSGEGRDRPIEELLVWGVLFLVLGAVAHGLMLLSLDRGGHGQSGPGGVE